MKRTQAEIKQALIAARKRGAPIIGFEYRNGDSVESVRNAQIETHRLRNGFAKRVWGNAAGPNCASTVDHNGRTYIVAEMNNAGVDDEGNRPIRTFSLERVSALKGI